MSVVIVLERARVCEGETLGSNLHDKDDKL